MQRKRGASPSHRVTSTPGRGPRTESRGIVLCWWRRTSGAMERPAVGPQQEAPPISGAESRRPSGAQRATRAPVDSVFSSISCTGLDARPHLFGLEWHWPDARVPHTRLFVCLAGEAAFAVGGEVYRLARGGTLLVAPHVSHHSVPEPILQT